jgi:hypothetical protein
MAPFRTLVPPPPPNPPLKEIILEGKRKKKTELPSLVPKSAATLLKEKKNTLKRNFLKKEKP